MAIADDACLVSHCFTQCFAQTDTNIFNRVMSINLQIALGVNGQVNQAVAGDLFKHMIQKRDTGVQL